MDNPRLCASNVPSKQAAACWVSVLFKGRVPFTLYLRSKRCKISWIVFFSSTSPACVGESQGSAQILFRSCLLTEVCLCDPTTTVSLCVIGVEVYGSIKVDDSLRVFTLFCFCLPTIAVAPCIIGVESYGGIKISDSLGVFTQFCLCDPTIVVAPYMYQV